MIIDGPLHVPNLVFVDDGFGNTIYAPDDQFERNFARLMQIDEE